MTKLITADIHMTNDPRDKHRWALLPWLAEQAERHQASEVLILGDLTGAKDRHPSAVVKRFSEGVAEIAKHCDVIILKGNHDYVDPESPFFGFLTNFPRVRFILRPTSVDLKFGSRHHRCLFLPSSTDLNRDWSQAPIRADFKTAKYIFGHQTFRGAQYENGTKAQDGPPPSIFRSLGFMGQAYSGDIHVPQVFKKSGITYIGSPYRIDFGDRFTPRVLLLHDDGSTEDIRFPCPSKHLVEINSDGMISETGTIKPHDQVKVRVTLQREQFPLWPKLRKDIRAMAERDEWEIYGPELRVERTEPATPIAIEPRRVAPIDLVRSYAKANDLDKDMIGVGLEILGACNDGRT